MTIDELIEKLAPYPGDWEVLYEDEQHGSVRPDAVYVGRNESRGKGYYKNQFSYRKPGMECNAVLIV